QPANNLVLMDASGARAVAEITPAGVTVRRASDAQALISTNHQRGATDLDSNGRCDRYDCLHDVASKQFGHVGVPQLERLLGRVSQGDMTLQSMIFEPSTRTLYLATGSNAPQRSYYRLNLGRYFSA